MLDKPFFADYKSQRSFNMNQGTNMLEQRIEELTAAIVALAAAMQSAAGVATMADPEAKRTKPHPKVGELKADGTPAAKTGPKGPSTEPNPAALEKARPFTDLQEAALKLEGTALDPAKYDFEKDVKPVLKKLSVEVGRDEFIAFLQRFGVNNVKLLSQGQYPMVVQTANEVIAKNLVPSAAEGLDDGFSDVV